MGEVDIALLKQLRDITLAPLKDCREAIIETNGDLEAAQEFLRKKGIMKAGSRGDRETKEGIVKVIEADGMIIGIKLLCETDFVAKNEDFIGLADTVLSKLAATKKAIKSIEDLDPTVAADINETIAAFAGKIGETMKLVEVVLSDSKGFVYNHPGNRIATVIYFDGDSSDFAKEIALQVTAMNPKYVSFDEVSADFKEKMLVEFRDEMKDSGKPADMIENIVQGKLKKSVAQYVLLEQEYIRDASKKVREVLPTGFSLNGFVRLAIS